VPARDCRPCQKGCRALAPWQKSLSSVAFLRSFYPICILVLGASPRSDHSVSACSMPFSKRCTCLNALMTTDLRGFSQKCRIVEKATFRKNALVWCHNGALRRGYGTSLPTICCIGSLSTYLARTSTARNRTLHPSPALKCEVRIRITRDSPAELALDVLSFPPAVLPHRFGGGTDGESAFAHHIKNKNSKLHHHRER
jgi:hypothetical protein